MAKKKGRQSGGFASKSMRAAFVSELRNHAQEVPRRPFSTARLQEDHSTRFAKQPGDDEPKHRPKLLLNRLRGILQERQFQDRMEYRVARRRRHQLTAAMTRNLNGTVDATASPIIDESQNLKRNPAGWTFSHGDNNYETKHQCSSSTVSSLQILCVQALGPALPDYLDALGRDTLQAMLELLPSPTLAALSVRVSSTIGMNDDLAYVIGKHNHVEKLALHNHVSSLEQGDGEELQQHSNPGSVALTDEGILALVPRFVSAHQVERNDQDGSSIAKDHVPDSWEEIHDADDNIDMEGCIRLKQLELVNARTLSLNAVSSLLARCSCVTHLSLSSSLQWNSGQSLLLCLPSLLPNLQVLDLSFCSWVTDALLRAFWRNCQKEREGLEASRSSLPVVCVLGCVALAESVLQELMYDYPGSLMVSAIAADDMNRRTEPYRELEPPIRAEEWVETAIGTSVSWDISRT